MERAEFAVGSVEVRGSGTVHRILSFLGAFFLGIGPAARQQEQEEENWWDRDESPSNLARSVQMTLGHQAELFDHSGQVAVQPLDRAGRPVADTRSLPEAQIAAPPISQTLVSVQAKSRVSAHGMVTTRVVPVTRVSSVAKTATMARGAVARQLLKSQSISSGREGARWFSVPQRVLLPRYQLFEGADAVTEDGGGLHIGSPSTRTQHGQVWFV